MPFKYYITDTINGIVLGTDDDTIASNLADCEDYFVVDSSTGEWMISGGSREVVTDIGS